MNERTGISVGRCSLPSSSYPKTQSDSRANSYKNSKMQVLSTQERSELEYFIFSLINPWETFWLSCSLSLSFLSFICFFQLSAIAGPHHVGADGNRALFSFPKGHTHTKKKTFLYEAMLHVGKNYHRFLGVTPCSFVDTYERCDLPSSQSIETVGYSDIFVFNHHWPF